MNKKSVRSNQTRLRLLDYYNTYSGRKNALSKCDLLTRENGINFHSNLDLTKLKDVKIYEGAWMRIMGAICVINKTTDGVKIMRDRFINDEEGKINKWFSVNKTSDAKIGEERQALKEEEAKKRKESFERLGELLMPTIFEELKIGEINRGDDD